MGRDDERYLPEPSKRGSPFARILALVALLGTVALLFVVISSSMGEGGEGDDSSAQTVSPRSDPDKEGPETPREVTVEEGDSLSGIAVKYGVSVKRIERLNPDLDPNTLATGQTVKLR
jgi:LysM repeat protein